jgi:diacylglycerol kinase (ATP)
MDTILFNPNAGNAKRSGLTAEILINKLEEKGVHAAIPQVETEEEMIDAAASARGRVIAVGGDGTIHSLLQAVNRCHALKLGIIPAGTANHFATALGLPMGIDAAIDVIARGHSKEIDLGRIDDTIFCEAAGAGLHARMFHIYGDRREKSRVAAATTALTVIAEWSPRPMRIKIDGELYSEEVSQVTVANIPVYGGILNIAPEAKMDDGLLDVVAFTDLSKAEVIQYGLAAMSGSHVDLPKTHMALARRVEIEAIGADEIEAHADALPAGHTPNVIEVLPRCLDVVVSEEVR